MNEYMQVGIGGALALLILKTVFDFVKRKNNIDYPLLAQQIKELHNRVKELDYTLIAKQIDDLYSWHKKEDVDGVKIWYVRKSLEDAIKQLSDNISKQTELLGELVRSARDQRKLCDLHKMSGAQEKR